MALRLPSLTEANKGRALAERLLAGLPEPPIWMARTLLCAILLIAAVTAFWHAAAKPFWFDEILTIEVSRLPSAGMRWQALYTGCDGMPPGYYFLNQLVTHLTVDPHIAWRLPSLLGWILALWAVYLFAATAAGRSAGLAAALLLALTNASSYAYEARPYALLVGVVALAAVCWQRAGRHWAWSAALAAFLMAATSLHYLAPLTVGCFALAETTLSLATRRFRRTVWVAFCAAALPTLSALPLLLKMKADFAAHFWSQPQPGGVPYYYGNLVGLPLNAALVLLPFGFACLLRAVLKHRAYSGRGQAVLLAGSILLLPIVSLCFTMATHGGFNERYALPVILGYALAIPLLLEWSPGGLARTFTAALLLAFLTVSARDMAQLAASQPARAIGPENRAHAALRLAPAGPMVVCNLLDFLPAWYYATPTERARLLFLGDLESAVRLGHTDGAVRLLLALRQFAPVPVHTFQEYLPGRQNLLLFTTGPGPLNWQPRRLEELGWGVQPLRPAADGQLYRAHAPAGR